MKVGELQEPFVITALCTHEVRACVAHLGRTLLSFLLLGAERVQDCWVWAVDAVL